MIAKFKLSMRNNEYLRQPLESCPILHLPCIIWLDKEGLEIPLLNQDNGNKFPKSNNELAYK